MMEDVTSGEMLATAINPQSRIVLDMEAISLLTKHNWLFSRFDIDERVYIFHWPETGEKCMLYVVGNDDMFISADEMVKKMPNLKESINNIAFTPISSENIKGADELNKCDLVISHPDDIEHDFFFIIFSTIDYLNGGGGFSYNQQDNVSDAIYDLKRFSIEKTKASDDEVARFHTYWQKITPYIEIFMTRSNNLSIQDQIVSQLSDKSDTSIYEMQETLFNLLLVMSNKVGIKINPLSVTPGDSLELCYKILDSFKKMRFFRSVSETPKEPQKVSVPNSYYQKLKDPENYPVPNKKAMEVYFIACRENTDYGELVESIKEDPALTAKILKYLNTPTFRTLNTISSISIEALSMFGLPRIKEIALNVAIDFRDFEIKCEAFNYKTFYQDSLACAIAARNITNYVNKTSPEKSLFTPDQAYTVGLLSQVGKLAFAAVCPQPYNRMLLEDTEGGGQELCEMEKKEFGIDHCEIASDMLSEWHFSDSFCKAVRFQYKYPENQDIFKDDVIASALASKLKAAGFMLRWSRTISTTINSSGAMNKKNVITTLDKGASEFGICPGNYHKQAVTTQKEWHTMKSIMDV